MGVIYPSKLVIEPTSMVSCSAPLYAVIPVSIRGDTFVVVQTSIHPLPLHDVRSSTSAQLSSQPLPIISATSLLTRSAVPCPVLLSIVNHPRLNGLLIIPEGIRPRCHHAAHRGSIARPSSWILGVCDHGRERVRIIIVHHAVNFLGNGTLLAAALPSNLSICGRYWVNRPSCCVCHSRRHLDSSWNKSRRSCIWLHVGTH